MLHAVPLLYSVIERSPCLFKKKRTRIYCHRVVILTCISNYYFPSSMIAPIEFSRGSFFFNDMQPLKRSFELWREQSSLWFGCNSWRPHMIPILFPLSSPRVFALLLLHRAQRHLCMRRLVERNSSVRYPECVAGTSVFSGFVILVEIR